MLTLKTFSLITVTDTDLEAVTSVKLIRKLYNNYELDTMVNEFVTPLEKKEENEFVDAIMGTSVMRHAMSFLLQKGKVVVLRLRTAHLQLKLCNFI